LGFPRRRRLRRPQASRAGKPLAAGGSGGAGDPLSIKNTYSLAFQKKMPIFAAVSLQYKQNAKAKIQPFFAVVGNSS
jgi:hypothetical protein